jgi:aminopeptidase
MNPVILSTMPKRLVASIAAATKTIATPSNSLKKNTCPTEDADKFNGLVLGIYEKTIEPPKLTASARSFDQQTNGGLIKLIKDFNLCGSSGTVKLFHNFETDYGAIALVGLGPECIEHNEFEARDQMMENVRIAAALGCQHLQLQNCDEIFIDAMGYPEQAAEGGILSIWKYQDNLNEQSRQKLPYLELYQSNEDSREQFISGIIHAEAQNMFRYTYVRDA